jgi:hypothetical protein
MHTDDEIEDFLQRFHGEAPRVERDAILAGARLTR